MAMAMAMSIAMPMAMASEGNAAMADSESGAADAQQPEPQPWAEMLPEALARIFANLPLEERMLQAPLVCRSWRRAALDPACWREVDLSEWSRLMPFEHIHRMVEQVVDRSSGQIQELAVCRLFSDAPIEYVATRAQSLKVLRIPFCQVTDQCILKIAPTLKFVTHLDISGCWSLTKVALACIGQCCKSLTRLDRNMSFFNSNASLQPEEYDDEAMAIATYMPSLRHLELCHGSLSNKGLSAILDSCKQLGFLDLRGCFNLEIEGSIAERCRQLQVVYKHKFSDQTYQMLDDFMSDDFDLQEEYDVFSDEGWEWYSSSDEIDVMVEDDDPPDPANDYW